MEGIRESKYLGEYFIVPTNIKRICAEDSAPEFPRQINNPSLKELLGTILFSDKCIPVCL